MHEQHAKNLEIINTILANDKVAGFLSNNISKYAIDIIRKIDGLKTDEAIAANMNMKINEARRLLNKLGDYGITRYDTHKDSKGWLTFEWYVDVEKLNDLNKTINSIQEENKINLPDNCDDFFICEKCYENDKIVLPFEAAFEHSFKCPECHRPLKRLSKQEVTELLAVAEKNI
ncbi:MAG: hypothetical protein QW091_02315 [Candidatus Micrarchaeaceae archaeon]